MHEIVNGESPALVDDEYAAFVQTGADSPVVNVELDAFSPLTNP